VMRNRSIRFLVGQDRACWGFQYDNTLRAGCMSCSR
jgi:hypothetical protein